MSATAEEEKGIKAFRENEYLKAIEHFSLAITLTNKQRIPGSSTIAQLHSLHAYRGQAYAKLGGTNLKSALMDARTMIKLSPLNPGGYLAAGKFLTQQGKPTDALKLVRYALAMIESPFRLDAEAEKAMKRNVANIEQLKEMEGRLEALVEYAALEDEKRRRGNMELDPLRLLPLELVEIVFREMDFRTLIRCMRVSRSWNNYFKNLHSSTFEHLDFTLARTPPKGVHFTNYIRYSQRRPTCPIRRITLSRLDSNELSKLVPNIISATAPSLHELRFTQGFPFMDKGLVETISTFMVNLKSLQINCEVQLTNILRNIHKLVHLEILKCTHASLRERPAFQKIQHPKIHTLHLDAHVEDDEETTVQIFGMLPPADHDENKPFHQLPNLQVLELHQWGISDVVPGWDLRNMTKLRSFELVRTSFSMFPLLPPTLTNLVIVDNPHTPIRAHGMDDLRDDPLLNLKQLNVRKNRCITADTLHILLGINTQAGDEMEGQEQVGGGEVTLNSNNMHEITYPHESPTSTTAAAAAQPKQQLKLTRLDISSCPHLTFATLDFLTVLPISTHLTYLNMSSLRSLDDHVSREFIHFRKLQQLEINYTDISGIGLINIAMMAGRDVGGLRIIGVAGCLRVGRDAIEKVKEGGAVVRYLEPAKSRAGAWFTALHP
ncbi:hypothetical protein DFH27DRAFT_547093 [Peziza echinospora]|nr:hypothetical protein DFH27DRAFT_547093 [Peziza echinospora]